MKIKDSCLFVTMITLIFLFGFGSSAALTAGDLPKGKLGYGFEKGLVAGKDYVSGQLIVGIEEGTSIQGVSQAAWESGGNVAKKIRKAVLLQFSSEKAAKDAVKKLIERPDITFIERNGFVSIPPIPTLPDIKGQQKKNASKENFNSSAISDKSASTEPMSALSVSDDPGTGYQWHHTVIRKTADLGTLSTTPPTVAVIDTGVDYTHPDLSASGKVIKGKNCVADNNDPFDDSGHGTYVAGIIAARAANSQYGEGICPNCKILAIKVLGSDGTGTFFDVACGMEDARTKSTTPATKVINMSLAGPDSTLVSTEVNAIKTAGKVLVAAAGNDNTTDVTNAYPGADPDTALRVMATEENDCRAWFSNFSPAGNPTRYNIAAPGWQIQSIFPQAGYLSLSGTSSASPIVAGAAALVWGEFPALTRGEVVSTLVTNGKKVSCGFAASTKRVDIRKAILGSPETAIIGRILDPFTGKAPSSPVTPVNAKLYSRSNQLASDQTNSSGFYEITGITAGTNRTLKGSRTGYPNTTVRNKITITSDKVAGPFTDALPKSRTTGDMTITLDWKRTQPVTDTSGCIDTCNGWDFDLLLRLPSGTYIAPYECLDSSCTTGDLMTDPYIKSPRDSYNDMEPLETIVINSAASNGTYMLFVDNPWFGAGDSYNPSWSGSLASVQKYKGANPAGTYAPAYAKCLSEYWHVGDLTKTGTSYTWTSVNSCVDTLP
jgi:subtilisin family serine protease